MKSSILYKHILIPRKLVLGSSLKCSDKFWSKLLRKKANQHSWDSTWTECSGIAKANRWPFHPVIDILSKVWCNWILSLSGSGSEGSDGMHPIMMYVNTRVGLGQPPPPGSSIQQSKTYFCSRFDAIGSYLWAAHVQKVAKGVLMLG